MAVDGAVIDTAISVPSSAPSSILSSTSTKPRSFHALKEKCALKADVFNKFRDKFQFPDETRAHLLRKGEKAYAFAQGEVCFYEVAFLCGIRFPVHPFIMELLNHLNITPG